jgi:hypothetical protein
MAKRLDRVGCRCYIERMFSTEASAGPRVLLARLTELVDELQALELTSCTDEDVLDFLRELETQKRRLPTVEHAAIAQVESRLLPQQRGCGSTAALLRQLLHIDPHEASGRVRAAAELGTRRALTGEPLPAIFTQTAEACAAGLISPRHAAVITDHVQKLPTDLQVDLDHTVEAILLDRAAQQDPTRLRTTAADLITALDQDGVLAEDHDRRRRRHLTIHRHADGSATLTAHLEPLCAEAALTVMDTLARPHPAAADGGKDPRTAAQRRHDALHDALLLALRSGQLPDCGGVAATILLTLTEQQLHDRRGTVTTGHGARISVPEALTLIGDAQIFPVTLTKTKKITAYGDTHRIFTQNQRLAMIARDGGCSFPDCDKPPAWCQAHHVTDFDITRHTRVDDGTLLCGFHHREHPRLGWRCTMLDGIPHWTPPTWLDPTQTPRRNHTQHPALELVGCGLPRPDQQSGSV